jgi:hypothetical protein
MQGLEQKNIDEALYLCNADAYSFSTDQQMVFANGLGVG